MKNKLLSKMRNGKLTTDQCFILSNVFPEQINKWILKCEKELNNSKFPDPDYDALFEKIKSNIKKQKRVPNKS